MYNLNDMIRDSAKLKWKPLAMVGQRVLYVDEPLFGGPSISEQIENAKEDQFYIVTKLLSSCYIKQHRIWQHWYLGKSTGKEELKLLNNMSYVPLNEGREMLMPAYTETEDDYEIVRKYEGSLSVMGEVNKIEENEK